MKICSSCKIDKSEMDFVKHSGNPDGLQYQCKACQKERYLANREKRIQQVIQRAAQFKPEKAKYDRIRRVEKFSELREYEKFRASLPHRQALRNQITAKRRAQLRNATADWDREFDDLIFKEAFNLAKIREELTGFKWHVDHVIPLTNPQVCGLHCGYNISVIPARVNILKSNKFEPHFERRV